MIPIASLLWAFAGFAALAAAMRNHWVPPRSPPRSAMAGRRAAAPCYCYR